MEIVRIAATRWLYPGIPLWLLLPALLGLALLAVPGVAGLRLSQIGLRSWSEWTTTEKSYFIQVVVLANVVFAAAFIDPLGNRVASPTFWLSLSNTFVPYLFFGFYQELVYRGMVQTEFVRRWGAAIGIVVANALYTFGPLHWNYFLSPASVGVPMFTAIFAIGLFFGVVYYRSENLWLVATFHAIGNAYIIWATGPIT